MEGFFMVVVTLKIEGSTTQEEKLRKELTKIRIKL